DGEVVIETLILPGDDDQEVSPGRYAGMPNVHRLPSLPRLHRWLEAAGAATIDVLDVSVTDEHEQRVTHWSGPVSLSDRLQPDDPSMTIEGWPAPLRAMLRLRPKRSADNS
ncbi:DUF1698 domain-containing protein, partial [Gammaproteobacteria bacterium]|nr:DUF1698 domain-containing protein [Gammaproteobacteria bacterium]